MDIGVGDLSPLTRGSRDNHIFSGLVLSLLSTNPILATVLFAVGTLNTYYAVRGQRPTPPLGLTL